MGRGAGCGAREARHARAVPLRRLQPGRALPLLALLAAFAAGMLVDWSLHTYGPPQPSRSIGGDIRGDTELRLDVARTRPLDGSPSHSKGTEEAALTKMEVVATLDGCGGWGETSRHDRRRHLDYRDVVVDRTDA